MPSSAFVHLFTRDIGAAIRFYRDGLGFRETFRTPTTGSPDHVELFRDGFGVGLGTVAAAKRVHGIDATPGTPSMELVLWTTDLEAAVDRLRTMGAPLVTAPHPSGNNNRAALLRDPDGNLVSLVTKGPSRSGDPVPSPGPPSATTA